MKCDKCGFNINPGDQVCMNCGAKLSLYLKPESPEPLENEKKSNSKYLALIIGGVLLFIFLVVLLVIFLIR